MIKLLKYIILLLIFIVLLGTAWLMFFPDKKISGLSDFNIFDNEKLVNPTPVPDQVSKPSGSETEELNLESPSENLRNEGIYKDTKSDEINSETKDDQINVNNGENLVPKPPASTGRSITEKISVANNIDNSGSVLDDDPTVKNSINKTPIKAAVVEKEPISLLWLSLVFSLLVNVLIILLFFQQIRWRKNIFNGQEVLMPEQWVNSLSDRMMRVFNALDQLGEFSKANYKNINEISEISQTLNNVIDSKEEEIKRFRKGYDEYIYHKFLSKFINITDAVNRLAQKDSVTRDDFENIHFRLTDALEDCRVSVKFIEVGSLYSDLGDLVEDNPKTISTENENQNLRVAEVMRPAYLVSSSEGSKVVLPAKVSIYVKN